MNNPTSFTTVWCCEWNYGTCALVTVMTTNGKQHMLQHLFVMSVIMFNVITQQNACISLVRAVCVRAWM